MEQETETFRTRRGHWDMNERRPRAWRRGGRGRGSDMRETAKPIRRPIPRKPAEAPHQHVRDEFGFLKDEYRQCILEFRTQPCPHECSESYCDMYHLSRSEKARRKPERLPSGQWNYLPTRCLQSCEDPTCPFAHSDEEIWYHPLKFKTEECKAQLDEGSCCSSFGYFCPFFHEEVDREPLQGMQYNLQKPTLVMPVLDTLRLQTEYKARLKAESEPRTAPAEPSKSQAKPAETRPQPEEFSREKYKTEPCQNPTCSAEDCLHHHNPDERRRENDSMYTFHQCPDTYIESARAFKDPSKCPRGDACTFSHTLNEVYYHRDYFGKTACSEANCRKKVCPFAHRSGTGKLRPAEPPPPPVRDIPLISKPENDLQMSLLDRMCKVNADIGGLKTQIEEAKESLERIEKDLACNHCGKPQQQFAFYCGHAFCQVCVEGNIKQKTYICRKCNKPSPDLIQMKYLS